MSKTGHADLPLHYGRVPLWPANRMKVLGGAIVQSIVMDYGKSEFLKRISDPLWFQSFGAVLGMDWHSSGITTSVMGALKRSLNPIAHELGIYICGGRGKHSRKTPQELNQLANQTGLDGDYLIRCSRLTAKVDSSAVQDNYQVYLHNFIVTNDGEWAVVQQGMNHTNGMARRYHWRSRDFHSFLSAPHTSIMGLQQASILNLVDASANTTQHGILNLLCLKATEVLRESRTILMPRHHDVRRTDINLKRLGATLTLAHETDISDFESLLLLRGVGPRTLQSLALVSEVIHGTPSRFSDPARFSFAHGGKDGHPFPVPLKVYDETIEFLNDTITQAKIGLSEKKRALKNLHLMSKKIESSFTPEKDKYKAWIDQEKAWSPQYGGRTVSDDQTLPPQKKDLQMRLF